MFPSPIFACVRAGGTPLYADLEMDCLGMSPFSLERILERPENNVRAVVVMHTAGIVSPRITDIAEMCNNHGVILIEDCAHAYGSLLWNGGHPQGAGSWGDFAVFSFYATKPMNCGEGGAIAADSRWENVLETVEALSRYGKTELFGAPWCPLPGYSNRMTEILCAIGVVEDKYLNRKVLKRFQVAAVYNNEIRIRGRLYGMFQGQNYYKYVMVPERTMFDRGTFRKVMKDDFGIGIPAGVYDFPVYDQPPLKEMTRSRLPNTDRFCLTHVCLPMHEGLNEEDASYVAKAVNEVLGE
jgi:dTDP-4-amino-4,6-dideoxygalactose transaminase